jgi:hypothetical protein
MFETRSKTIVASPQSTWCSSGWQIWECTNQRSYGLKDASKTNSLNGLKGKKATEKSANMERAHENVAIAAVFLRAVKIHNKHHGPGICCLMEGAECNWV